MGNGVEFKKQSIGDEATLASLTLSRPDKANAFDISMIQELRERLAEASNDRSIRCLILSGAGKNFCAGADLGWMQRSQDLSEDENAEEMAIMSEMFANLAQLPMPSIALVRGAAYGGAVGMVACCDLVVAQKTARFAISEGKIGLLPAVIYPYLMRKIPQPTLRQMTLTGHPLSAQEGHRAGFVHTIYEDLEDETATLRGWIDQLLKVSPESQRAAKILAEQLTSPIDHTLAREAIAQIRRSPLGPGRPAIVSRKAQTFVADFSR